MLASMMKTQVLAKGLVARAFAVGLMVASASASFAACSGGGDIETTQGSGGSGPAGPGSGGGATTGGGMGGMGMDAGDNGPLEEACNDLCGYLAAIDCKAWPGCAMECAGAFNAPDACKDEFQKMIECWVQNQSSFTCTATQLVPPPECQPLEAAFNECFGGKPPDPDAGPGSCMAQQGVCNKTDESCSCKTSCGGNELKWACSLPQGAQVWSCSCYQTNVDVDMLIGTCTQADMGCLNNAMGCCEPYFVQ
jgi:hypothetical protein